LNPSSEAADFSWLLGTAPGSKMAEVDFGDRELFEQLDDAAPSVNTHIRFTEENEKESELGVLRSRLEESDSLIQKLTEENILRLLWIQRYGVTVDDVNVDGPVLQILYANNLISNVQHFTTFSVDKLGQPLLNENSSMTDGWEVPVYQQIFNQVIGTNGQDIEMKDKRPKSMCFNCGSVGHQLRDCPKPKDMAAINERRKEFNQNSNQAMQGNRYHADEVEERFSKYKPGIMSEELLSALGIDNCSLPPLIYRMRQLGYPPGWLKEAEMEHSGLALYDVSNDGSSTEDPLRVSYDVSKLVDFPGFNVATPHKMKDVSLCFGCFDMFKIFSSQPGAACNKRRHESDSSPQKRKKYSSSPDRSVTLSSDMDIESGSAFSVFFNQSTAPLLPPPHPPLPKGTPPLTPPTNGSPALRGQGWVTLDQEGTTDELSLEELEEQQRLIWAALENADTATNSDCETPAIGTPTPSSPSVCSSAQVDNEFDEVEDASQKGDASGPIKSQGDPPQTPGPIRLQEDTPKSPEPVKFQEYTSFRLIKMQDDSPDSPLNIQDDTPLSPEGDEVDKNMPIPHRSNFAAGIVPFEETPEFMEVAEATGTYLKIRDLLKSSPRSLQKKKKKS
uniref:Zinc finger CCHC domain-containing protein 8 n=1 Tax=Periophthalmus magnuspinnatus TaxID=409849 RepID=A0A3B3Z978_9GOBI